MPHAGPRVVRMGLAALHYLGEGRKGVPNQVLVSFVRFFPFVSCVSGVYVVSFPCFKMSLLVQSIAWKDSSPK